MSFADPEAAVAAIFSPTPEQRDDPYPAYAYLRSEAPVHRSESLEAWVCSRYADVTAVLGDRRVSSTPDLSQGWGGASSDEAGPTLDVLGRVLLFMDGEEHARIRRLINKAFTPKAVERLRGRVATIADGLLDRAAATGRFELVDDFAFPLPVTVIADMLGVPPGDHADFREQVPKLTPLLEFNCGPEAFERAGEAVWFFAAYFLPLFEARRSEPTDDLISALVHAEIDGDHLDPVDALVTCILLLGAGHETTMNLLGNGLLALLRNRDQLEILRQRPEIAPAAVEELLRYDSPVQLTVRRLTEDMEVGGQTIAAGEELTLLLGAANHDPANVDHPDRLDLERSDCRHVAFSHGPHFCLGAALARLEAEVAFTTMLQRLPALELDGEAHFRPTTTLRGLTDLRLACGVRSKEATTSPA